MKIIQNTIIIAIIIAIIMAFCTSCSEKFYSIDILCYEGKYPDESAKDMLITYSENGMVSFIVSAPVLNKYYGEYPYSECPKGVKVISYDANGKKRSTLTADYAVQNDYQDIIEASGNIVIYDLMKDETIETEKLVWNKREKRIYSDVEIKQTKADGSVNIGDGLEANENFTKYSIKNPHGIVVANDLK